MNETPLPLIVCATSAFGTSSAPARTTRTSRAGPRGRARRRSRRASRTRAASPRGRRARGSPPSVLSDWSSFRSTITQSRPSRPCAARLQRLPVLALLQLAVAGHHDDAAAAAEQPLRPRDPAALRDAHPERAGVRLDPGHADVRVPVEAAEPAQLQQALVREHAERVERGVEAGDVVALRREEDVAVRVVPAELGDVQLAEEEVRDEVERAEARAEVPGAGALHRDERVRAAHVGEQRERRVVAAARAHAVELGARDQAQLRHGA